MESPQRDDASALNEWPLCPRDRDRLEYAAERVAAAREVLRRALTAEDATKQPLADAALDLTGVLLTLSDIGVPLPRSIDPLRRGLSV